ncbi:hypothetical protein LJC28_01670 [Dysgonomonas sp. OttesenSCG-928-D17]|nr:hypothetical protein [Dysgonomonas sp. OttesenSCG-928-D17]
MKKLFLFIVLSFFTIGFNACSDTEGDYWFSSVTIFVDGRNMVGMKGAEFSFNPEGISKLVINYKQDPSIILLFTVGEPRETEVYDQAKDERFISTSYKIINLKFGDYDETPVEDGYVQISQNRKTVVNLHHSDSHISISGSLTFKP